MKKAYLVAAILMAAITKSYAAGLYEIDWEKKVWRSSVPATATSNMLLAVSSYTGIAVNGIMVSSVSLSPSNVSVMNGTSTVNGLINSTFTYTTGYTGYTGQPAYFIPIHKVFNEGLLWTNTGVAVIELLWDWVGKPPTSALDATGRY